jgi:gamma-glutamylaminecyclotransferase
VAVTTLFVYGTLKRGQRNHRLLAGQEFLGGATTAPRYRVFDLGDYPGMICDERTGLAIRGELWAVGECCLAELDDFEDVPDWFVRKPIGVPDRGQVWAYFLNAPVPEGAKSGDRWPLRGE